MLKNSQVKNFFDFECTKFVKCHIKKVKNDNEIDDLSTHHLFSTSNLIRFDFSHGDCMTIYVLIIV